MKSLSEIQQDLRALMDHISNLNQEIELVKPKEAINREQIYEKINRLAKEYPIVNQRLRKTDELARKSYLELLMAVVHYGQHQIEDKLLFVQRIAIGIAYGVGADDLLKSGVIVDGRAFDEALEHVNEHKHSLLLDCLLAANVTGSASEKELEFIAELAALFAIDHSELALIANLAQCLIQQEEDAFDQIVVPATRNWFGMFTHQIPEEWLAKRREYCGKIFSYSRQGSNLFIAAEASTIRKGEIIFSRDKERNRKRPSSFMVFILNSEIKAKKDGFVMYIDLETSTQAFVAHAFDGKEEVKAWQAQQVILHKEEAKQS